MEVAERASMSMELISMDEWPIFFWPMRKTFRTGEYDSLTI